MRQDLCSSGRVATLAGIGGPSTSSFGDAHATGEDSDIESETLHPVGRGPLNCGFVSRTEGVGSNRCCSGWGGGSAVASTDGFVTRYEGDLREQQFDSSECCEILSLSL